MLSWRVQNILSLLSNEKCVSSELRGNALMLHYMGSSGEVSMALGTGLLEVGWQTIFDTIATLIKEAKHSHK